MADGAWELRIHGVSNTPPASVLHSWKDGPIPPDRPWPIELVAGDDTTGFYQRVRTRPGGPKIEAFSWGQLTSGRRNSGDRVVRDLRRAAWSMLLPFALVNVALWARPTVSPKPGDTGAARLLAWLVRVLALSLTITVTTAAAGVGMDLLAWQCHADCSRTPPGLGWLGGSWLAVDGRLVLVGALLPLILVCGLVWLAGKTFQYEAITSTEVMGEDEARHPLADRQFWAGSSQVRTLRRLHTIAALGVVAHLLAASAWVAPGASGWVVPVGLTVSISSVVMVISVGASLLLRPDIRQRRGEEDVELWNRGRATVVRCVQALLSFVVPGVVLLVAAVVAAFGPGPAGTTFARLPGYESTLSLLFLVQFFLLSTILLINLFAARKARIGQGRHADDPAWHGLGTTVLAGAGWILALLYSVAVLFGVAWWSNGGSKPAGRDALVAPSLQWAAFGLVLAVAVVAVVATLAGASFGGLRRVQTARVVEEIPGATEHEKVAAAAAGRWRALHLLSGYHALTQVGRLASLVFAISTVGAVVGLCKVVALWSSSAPWVRWVANPWKPDDEPPRGLGRVDTVLTVLSNIGGLLAVAVMLGLAALIGAAYRSPAVRRVVGVVWDIATFWPRGAHPFAPPCYAERAVPQLVTRVSGRSDVPVIVAGHSQGSLLAAACVFQLTPLRRRTVYLVTFGTQMTRFYGRVFPAFFGLRSREELALALSDRDPARAGEDAESLADEDLSSVRWRSFWRNTDPLGWPIGRWDERAPGEGEYDPTDRLGRTIDVQVVDPTGYRPERPGEVLDPRVRQHSDYPLSKEYAEGTIKASDVLEKRRT
jgi:hypothetical protein